MPNRPGTQARSSPGLADVGDVTLEKIVGDLAARKSCRLEFLQLVTGRAARHSAFQFGERRQRNPQALVSLWVRPAEKQLIRVTAPQAYGCHVITWLSSRGP